MELSVKERIILLGILSKAEGNLTTLRVVRELQNAAGLTDEEGALLNIRQEAGSIHWDEGKVGLKEIPVGDFAKKAVLGVFKKIEESDSLTMEMLPLYEKFLL